VRLLVEAKKYDAARRAAQELLSSDKPIMDQTFGPIDQVTKKRQTAMDFHCRKAQLLLCLGKPREALASLAASDIDSFSLMRWSAVASGSLHLSITGAA
jgi:hypothetical protein